MASLLGRRTRAGRAFDTRPAEDPYEGCLLPGAQMNIADAAAFVGMCGAGVVGIKIIVDGVVRFATLRRTHAPVGRVEMIEQRLEHLTTAIDAIAVELERQGELQRFSAQLTLVQPPDVDSSRDSVRVASSPHVVRPITPH